MSYEKITLVVNLGRKPEMKFLPSGQAVTTFSAASNRSYTGKDGQRVKKTTWWRVSVWGNSAEACNQYLDVGSQALIEGRMNTDENGNPRIWTDGDGNPRASYEITADRVVFMGGGGATEERDDFATGGSLPDDQEIPFA